LVNRRIRCPNVDVKTAIAMVDVWIANVVSVRR